MTPSSDLLARAARIRLACFDVDGTLTDGGLYYDEDGRQSKRFHVQDGLGLRLLEEHGIAVALITARAGEVTAKRARELIGRRCHGRITPRVRATGHEY